MHPPASHVDPFGPDDSREDWRARRSRALALASLAMLCFFAPLGGAMALIAVAAAREDSRALRAARASRSESELRRVRVALGGAILVLAIGAACAVIQASEVAATPSTTPVGGFRFE